jgi:hypothetical protein
MTRDFKLKLPEEFRWRVGNAIMAIEYSEFLQDDVVTNLRNLDFNSTQTCLITLEHFIVIYLRIHAL